MTKSRTPDAAPLSSPTAGATPLSEEERAAALDRDADQRVNAQTSPATRDAEGVPSTGPTRG